MSRVVNFLSGDTANFTTSEGDWYVSQGEADLTPTREKQIFSDTSSLKIEPTIDGTLTLSASPVAIDPDYTGWPLKSSAWIWASDDIKVYSNLYINYVSLSEQASAEQYVRGQKWTLVKVNETIDQEHPDETTNVSWDMRFADTGTSSYLDLPGTSGSYASSPDATDLDILGTEGTKFLSLPGVTGNFAQTASDAAFNLAGVDAEWIVCANIRSFSAVDTVLLSRPYGSGWFIFATGAGRFGIGFCLAASPSTVQYSYTDSGFISAGTTTWIRVTRNTTTGEVLLYKSESSPTVVPTSWTSVASIQPTPPAGDLVSNSQVLSIANGTNADIYRAIIKSNGTTIYDANFTTQAIGATSFTESTGKTVTVTGSAAKIVDGTTFLTLSGTTGTSVTTPDSAALDLVGTQGTRFFSKTSRANSTNFASVPAAIGSSLDITGDISIAVHIDRAYATEQVAILSRRQSGVDSALTAYNLGQWTNASNQPSLGYTWTDSAGVTYTKYGTAHVPTTYTHVGVTHDVDDGAGNNVVRFYGSTDGSAWTLLETFTTVGTTSHRSNAAQVGIGGTDAGVYFALGKYYRARIWNTASSASPFTGTPVLDADFRTQSVGATSFVCTSGQTVTLSGVAARIIDDTTFLTLPGTTGNYASAPDAAALDILGAEGTKFLSLPGTNGNYASTPDTAALDITGDIEVVARVAFDDWSRTGSNFIAGKRATTGGQRSWLLEVIPTGHLRWYWSADGTTETYKDSTVSTSFTDGQAGWVKVTFDVDNGAGGNDIKFYTASDSTSEPTSWTQLGTTVTTAGTTSIFNSTAILTVGTWADGGNSLGKFYRTIVRNGIGGSSVFDADFTARSIGTTSFTESTGKTVTVTGSAAKIVDDTTFLFLNGSTGNYASAPDSADLDITGDIEIVARVAVSDWTPSATNALISKLNASGSYSYELNLATGGTLQLRWSSDGTTIATRDSTIAIPATDGTAYWVKATLDVDNGAAGHDVKFYYAADSGTEPASWTQLGTTVTTAGTTSVFSSTASLAIGSRTDTGSPTNGKFYRAIVRNGIAGTTVFNADFSRQVQFATTFTEATGKTVTINGTGARIERNRDIELVLRVAADDWTSPDKTLIAKWNSTGNQRSYYLRLGATAIPYLGLSADGATGVTRNGTAAFPFTDGVPYWIKATLDVDNGAGGHDVKFYYAADSSNEPTSWTQLGSTVTTAGITSVFSGTATLDLGMVNSIPDFSGRFYCAIVRNGFYVPPITSTMRDVTVFHADFSQQFQFTGTFREGSSNAYTVTITGTGARVERNRDIEIVARFALDDWTPSAVNAILAKWGTSDGTRSYYGRIDTDGRLTIVWSPDGTLTSALQMTSFTAPTLTNGTAYWLKWTLDVNNGTGGRTARFYYAADQEVEPTSWTQISTDRTDAGTTSVYPGTDTLRIGDAASTLRAAGRFYQTIVRNGIAGSPVFKGDFTRQIQFASTFTETSGNSGLVTVSGAGARIERDRSIELVVRAALDDWADGATEQRLLGKWNTSANRSYGLSIAANGQLIMRVSSDGQNNFADQAGSTSPVVMPLIDGRTYWLKATKNAVTGIYSFYYAEDQSNEPTSWTSAGSTTTAYRGSPYPGTGVIEVGTVADGTSGMASGKVYRTIIRNGIGGTEVFDADFSSLSAGTTSFTEDTGKTVSLLGSATTAIENSPILSADTIYIANPVLATPHAVMVSPFDNELYLRLPEYMRTADSQQEDPDYPLFRFIDVTFMEPGDVWDLWERLRYIDPVSEGGEKLSELVDPATIDTAWMPWLASILGLQFFNPSTGFTSWAALEAALATWQAWEEDVDPTPGGPDTEWSEIELFQPDSVDLESELRWQLSTAVYGLNGGTTGALKIAAKHVLTDTQTVVVNRNVGGDPWHIELVTLLSETPDVVSAGDSSGTVLDVIAPAIPAGYEVSHRAEVSV